MHQVLKQACETKLLNSFVKDGTFTIFTNIVYNYQSLLRQSNSRVSLFFHKGHDWIFWKVYYFKGCGRLSKIWKSYTFEIPYIIFSTVLTPINPLTVVKIDGANLSLENLALKIVFFNCFYLKEGSPKISSVFSWVSAGLRRGMLQLKLCFYCNHSSSFFYYIWSLL